MNFLEKLDYLMESQGLNKNSLSQLSEVPYTTIDSLYKKGYENVKLSTLKRLSKSLNVSLDFLVRDDEGSKMEHKKSTPISEGANITPERKALIDAVNSMDDDAVNAMLDVVNSVMKLRDK